MGLLFSISNFFITKTPLANNWRRKKIPSCSYLALGILYSWLISTYGISRNDLEETIGKNPRGFEKLGCEIFAKSCKRSL